MTKIALAVCCNNTKPATLASLMQIAHSRVVCGWTTVGVGLLPFVRNGAIQQVYEKQPDFTHLLFVDDDMSDFNEDHVLALLEADEPIISGLITARLPPYKLISSLQGVEPKQVLEYIQTNTVVKEDHVGMAFTLIKRRVLDALKQPNDIWFTMDRMPRKSFMHETAVFIEGLADSSKPEVERYKEAIAWGRLAHVGAELIGEDVEFCRRAKHMGFDSFTHCGVVIGHIGSRPYTVRDNLIFRAEEEALKCENSNI